MAIFPDALIVAGVYAVLYTLGVWIDKQSWSPSYPGEFMRTMLAFFYGQAGATVLLIALGTPIAVSLMLLAGMLAISAVIAAISVYLLDHKLRIVDV